MNWLSAIAPMGLATRGAYGPGGRPARTGLAGGLWGPDPDWMHGVPAARGPGAPGDGGGEGLEGQDELEACGWFDSSHSLRAGLEIVELGAGALAELFEPSLGR